MGTVLCERCRREVEAGDISIPGIADLDINTLLHLTAVEHCHLPNASGVYFAVCQRGVCYIGSAQNFFLRWRHHPQLERLLVEPDAVIAWLVINDKTARQEYEMAAIRRFRPLWNVRGAEHVSGGEHVRLRKAIRKRLKQARIEG